MMIAAAHRPTGSETSQQQHQQEHKGTAARPARTVATPATAATAATTTTTTTNLRDHLMQQGKNWVSTTSLVSPSQDQQHQQTQSPTFHIWNPELQDGLLTSSSSFFPPTEVLLEQDDHHDNEDALSIISGSNFNGMDMFPSSMMDGYAGTVPVVARQQQQQQQQLAANNNNSYNNYNNYNTIPMMIASSNNNSDSNINEPYPASLNLSSTTFNISNNISNNNILLAPLLLPDIHVNSSEVDALSTSCASIDSDIFGYDAANNNDDDDDSSINSDIFEEQSQKRAKISSGIFPPSVVPSAGLHFPPFSNTTADRSSGSHASANTPTRKRSSHQISTSSDNDDEEGFRFREYQVKQWNRMHSELVKFHSVFGHSQVPNKYEPNPTLAGWTKRQRYQYKNRRDGKPSTMSEERIAALEKLGFIWESQGLSWNDRFQDLKEYSGVHGHCNVPSTFSPNPRLATWVKHQRRHYKLLQLGKNSNMTLQRIDMLNKVGFKWVARKNA